MWLHRSAVVWIYLVLLTLHTIFFSVPHIPHLVLFLLHLYLLHKFTVPYFTNNKALLFLRSRLLLAVILSFIADIIHSVWNVFQLAAMFVIFFFSTSGNLTTLIQFMNGNNNTDALQSAANTTFQEITGLSIHTDSEFPHTLDKPFVPGLAHIIKLVTIAGIFQAVWCTAMAWLMTKDHLSMVTTVSDGYVRVGEVRLSRVMTFTLVGALGVRIGDHISSIISTFFLAAVSLLPSNSRNPWWLVAVVEPIRVTMSLSRALVSAATFAISVALSQTVWSEVPPLLLMNFIGFIAETRMSLAGSWEKWPWLMVFGVLLEGVVVLYKGWKCFRQMGSRNRGSRSLNRLI